MTESKALKYTALTARILLGLVFVVFGFGYFFMGDMPIDISTPAGKYASGLLASGFFFPFLKIVEGIAGLMLFFRRWTPLALLILAPIIIQILFYDIFLDSSGLIVGIVVTILAIFLGWYNWDKYKGLFEK
jgi:putative oxidoreductase